MRVGTVIGAFTVDYMGPKWQMVCSVQLACDMTLMYPDLWSSLPSSYRFHNEWSLQAVSIIISNSVDRTNRL